MQEPHNAKELFNMSEELASKGRRFLTGRKTLIV
jgi:hypothetical protein